MKKRKHGRGGVKGGGTWTRSCEEGGGWGGKQTTPQKSRLERNPNKGETRVGQREADFKQKSERAVFAVRYKRDYYETML